ncbi:MAG: hypothetical protein GKR85_09185 [Candidatus Nanopelagicales bacterium]|nr:hypothetical protein [Candidatus Nanopelagicales bacterium]
MKKTLGRLGSVAAAVGLVAAGLVGFAGPAQAGEIDGNDYVGLVECDAAQTLTAEQATTNDVESAFPAKCNQRGFSYVGYTKEPHHSWKDYFFFTPYGCPIGRDCTATEAGGGAVIDPPLPDEAYCEEDQSWSHPLATSELIDICGPSGAGLLQPYVNRSWTDDEGKTQKWKAVGKRVNAGDGPGESEPVQKTPPPPPPCWDATINNCPVGGALRFAAPKYAMVGVPVTMYAYASWRPDANAPSQPTNGTAVVRVDGEDYAGVEFVDGVAEWRFIPETEGMKEFTASGVLFSGLSGANAYIDTVPARTYVLEYDPAAYATALKKKRVEVGDTYVITDPNQARSYLEDRYEWSVSEKSDDVCAVYETKKGAVKAKFTDSGKCTVIWLDKESEESGKYTFIAKK